MKKSYILIYNDTLGTREEVKKVVDDAPMIISWRYDIPHAFYLISESSAQEISNYIHGKLGDGRLVVAEIGENYWGRTHKDTWYFIKNKKVRPKEEGI